MTRARDPGAGRRPRGAWGLALAGLVAAAAATSPPVDGLTRLAAAATLESERVQADFAAVALSEVIRAYEAELDRLSHPGQVSRRELAKQSRWARALERFLDDLHAAQEELDAGAPVRILVAPPGPVQLLVGERLVEVSSPRIDEPGALGRDIVTLFCDAFPCDPAVFEPAPEPRDTVTGGWSFRAGMGSTFETVDGLGFMFRDVRRRGEKEAACRRVHGELLRLVDALEGLLRRGRPVHFDALTLESPGAGDDQRVVVTRDGTRMRISLPALARAPAVVEVARTWLRARAEGREHRQLFPRADLLLAGLLTAR